MKAQSAQKIIGVFWFHLRAVDRCGGAPSTTNNQMELMAAIEALGAVPDGAEIRLVTDSVYVKDGITSWINNWKRRASASACSLPAFPAWPFTQTHSTVWRAGAK